MTRKKQSLGLEFHGPGAGYPCARTAISPFHQIKPDYEWAFYFFVIPDILDGEGKVQLARGLSQRRIICIRKIAIRRVFPFFGFKLGENRVSAILEISNVVAQICNYYRLLCQLSAS
jgi:hypothetical protein